MTNPCSTCGSTDHASLAHRKSNRDLGQPPIWNLDSFGVMYDLSETPSNFVFGHDLGGQIGDFVGIPVIELTTAQDRNIIFTAEEELGLVAQGGWQATEYGDLAVIWPYEPEGEPQDLGTCPWYRSQLDVNMPLNPTDIEKVALLGKYDLPGICGFGCQDEPSCQTDEPEGGWPSTWLFTDVELPFGSG